LTFRGTGAQGAEATELNPSSLHLGNLSRPAWLLGLTLSIAMIAVGAWGFLVEEPANRAALQALTYIVVPVLVLAMILVGSGHRPIAVLAASALIDLEAVLVGGGPLVALPFVVAVPLVGVAAAVRVLPPSRLIPPYVAAWFASSAGVAIAVFNALGSVHSSALVVIPCFSIVDALALALLWHMDASRIRALTAVAEAEARARELLENVDLMGVHLSPESRVDFVNDFGLRLTGWTRDEVMGKDWWDTFSAPELREGARAEYVEVVSGRRFMERQRESTILTKSGDRRLIRWSHVTRHDADGRAAGVASLGEDITAIRAAEDELRRDAELLSTLVVSSPLPTAVVCLDRSVQLWNPALAELLGWSEAEAVGRPVPAALYGHARWTIGRRFVRAVKGESFAHELVELSRRDGGSVRVRLYGGALRDREGQPMAVAMQAVDVTAALAMEEQLREAQKMEAVGRLAGGVAHDFNNSLTAIGGFASLILSSSEEPESREAAETILGAAKRAADLTRELLAYSRRSLLQPQTIDVNALVGAVRPMLLHLLGEDVSVVIESRVSAAMVRVDPNGLERVILNLAANARDAMPGGGRLTISTDRRGRDDATDGKDGRWVAISVSDTGAGIPPELHSQVFDPFFTTKPVGSGTGLGLAMVKGFVVQSGGQVSLVSRPGQGTTIEILLPEMAGELPPAPEPVGPEALGRGETVLVVEDDPAVAAVSFQVLSRRGYRVLLADRGESAIALLRGHSGPIALLLVDVILPGMRGPQVVDVARALHPESAVLFASGYSTEAIGRLGELPADIDLIEKPYVPEQLLARVRDGIDRAAAATAPAATLAGISGGPTDPA
jgi:two-component system cell cycle sensor histidine kinase/response regulator CckA